MPGAHITCVMKLFSLQRTSTVRLQIARPLCAGRKRVPALRCAVGQQSFPDAFNERAREAQEKLKQWAEEQQLQEKLQGAARDAATKAQQAAERVQDSASRTAAQLDREYEVSKKAQQAAERVREAADGVDVKYGLRRRASQAWADVKRKWPTVCASAAGWMLGSSCGCVLCEVPENGHHIKFEFIAACGEC